MCSVCFKGGISAVVAFVPNLGNKSRWLASWVQVLAYKARFAKEWVVNFYQFGNETLAYTLEIEEHDFAVVAQSCTESDAMLSACVARTQSDNLFCWIVWYGIFLLRKEKEVVFLLPDFA